MHTHIQYFYIYHTVTLEEFPPWISYHMATTMLFVFHIF